VVGLLTYHVTGFGSVLAPQEPGNRTIGIGSKRSHVSFVKAVVCRLSVLRSRFGKDGLDAVASLRLGLVEGGVGLVDEIGHRLTGLILRRADAQ